jgi:glycosyltransferase involved in cell wall biosynthesis
MLVAAKQMPSRAREPDVRADRRLRVLHVIPQLGSGGAERFVLTLMRKVDPAVIATRLCVLGSVNRFPERAVFPEPTEFLHFGGSNRDVIGLWRCVRDLRRLIRAWGADIVHSHLWPAARVAALAVRGTGARHVVQIQDTRPWVAATDARSRLTRFVTRRVLPGSRPRYVAVSRAARDYTCGPLGIRDIDVSVIPNAVETDLFCPPDDAPRSPDQCSPISNRNGEARPLRIGVVARLSPEKGHAHLFRAFRQLRERGLDAALLVAGEGSLRDSLQQLAAKLGIADRVQFTGLVPNVPEFLRSVAISVLPSLAAEGLPLTILEAMATGLPVVATDVAGAGEVIEDSVSGLLVPPGDDQALADALARLAADDALRARMGSAAVAVVRDRFSFDAIARRMEAVYQEVLAS